MINKIGKIHSIDFNGLLEYVKPLDRNERVKLFHTPIFNSLKTDMGGGKTLYDFQEFLCPTTFNNTAELAYKKSEEVLDEVIKSMKHYNLFNEKFDVCWEDGTFVAFFYSKSRGVYLPKRFVTIDRAYDYSNLTCLEVQKCITDGKEFTKNEYEVAVKDNKTHNQLKSELDEKKALLDKMQKDAENELAEFRRKMAEQEQALREKQEELLSHYRGMLEDLKDQIFRLEINIFALRSRFGETFSITQVREGRNASEILPVILYQKFRYMDEELTKASINTRFKLEGSTILDLFTEYYDELIDYFCPAEKCMTFFKSSKSGKVYQHNYENDVVEELEYYHGNQLGIVIRNGENVYLVFLDPEVMLQDNLFISNVTQEAGVEIGKSRIRDKEARPMINRYMIFIILKALIENTNIFSEIKGENLMNSSKVIFSNADGQITSNKYPTFRECFTDRDVELKEGDEIFIADRHNGSTTKRSDWGYGYTEEHRSRGYANRGRDAEIERGLSKLNIIENTRTSYHKQIIDENSMVKKYWTEINKDEYEKLLQDGGVVMKRDHYEYFVSCKREISDWQRSSTNGRINNVNLQIYRDEFMSIMWINSNYVQSWIDKKETNGEKDFVYFAGYLKELLNHLLDRETEEFKKIWKYIEFDMVADNIDMLTEWKKNNIVRNFTDYQAKRFANYVIENYIKE